MKSSTRAWNWSSRRFDTGPGAPVPTGRPSTDTTGAVFLLVSLALLLGPEASPRLPRILAAGCMLGKYWSIFLLVGLVLAALIDRRRLQYFFSAAPWITVAHSVRFDPVRKEVTGYKMDATSHHYFNNTDIVAK